MSSWDAIVVGAGPNGLAAAIAMAQAGCRVLVVEASDTIGGGCRSGERTLPGYVHDFCSSVHPLAKASPFFRRLPLEAHGLRWIGPPNALAHPLDRDRVVLLQESIDGTAAGLGPDATRYRKVMTTLANRWDSVEELVLGPPRWPKHPLAALQFASQGIRSTTALATNWLRTESGQALLAGVGAHSLQPLHERLTGGITIILTLLAHKYNWVLPVGGAQQLTNALGAHLRAIGGQIQLNQEISSLNDLPPCRTLVCDLTPGAFLSIARGYIPAPMAAALSSYRYGFGLYKIDWALDGPVPWANPLAATAATVHIGGTLREIAESEADCAAGRPSSRPFVILVQPTLFDASRAPKGKHVLWGYCHVPNGSTANMTAAIEKQIERFAPGFVDTVLCRAITTPQDFQRSNANMVGGAIGARQMRLQNMLWPLRRRPYGTPVRGVFLCSGATPPGPGVHGMCGFFAAQQALRYLARDGRPVPRS